MRVLKNLAPFACAAARAYLCSLPLQSATDVLPGCDVVLPNGHAVHLEPVVLPAP